MEMLGGRNKSDEYEFFDVLISNSYWQISNDLIIKEYMYLDAIATKGLNHGDPLLSEDCIAQLRDDLTSNLSETVRYTEQEALLLFTTSLVGKGIPPGISNAEYIKLQKMPENSKIMELITKVKALPYQNIHNSIVEYLLKRPNTASA